jgi:SAM-dependent methyltransferase
MDSMGQGHADGDGRGHAHAHAGRARRNIHSHTWIVGVLGLLAGLILLVYVPSLEAVSRSVLLFAGFHLIGGVVLLASLYIVGLRTLLRHAFSRKAAVIESETLDFGWGPEWMNGLAVAALVALAGAVAIEVSAPGWWPVAFMVLALGVFFLIGNFVMRSFRSRDHIVLPMVDLLRSDSDVVLDAGCGAGRTTIALGRVLGEGRVVAVDRFDADYIDDGGRALLDRNLRIAGLSGRVSVETADLTALPFDEASFDSAVSTNVYDHLGKAKEQGLREAFRVLRPGGRFLLAVWVPGWEMFTVGSFLSILLTSKEGWRRMARRAGFEVIDEGAFNYAWFVLLEKPARPAGTPT